MSVCTVYYRTIQLWNVFLYVNRMTNCNLYVHTHPHTHTQTHTQIHTCTITYAKDQTYMDINADILTCVNRGVCMYILICMKTCIINREFTRHTHTHTHTMRRHAHTHTHTHTNTYTHVPKNAHIMVWQLVTQFIS